MSTFQLADDEIIITVFHPPKRAAFFLLLKNSKGHLFILLLIIYNIIPIFYSSYKEPVVPAKPQTNFQTMSPAERSTSEQSLAELKKAVETNSKASSQNKSSSSYSYSGSYEIHLGDREIKLFFAKVFIFIMLIDLFFLIRKHRERAISFSYTITNKRIIVFTPSPKQNIRFIYYRNQSYRAKKQTLAHQILNLYYIQFSRDPLKDSLIESQVSPNDRLDYLTREQADYLMKMFANPIDSNQAPGQQKSPLVSNIAGRDSSRALRSKIIIRSSQRYLLFLIPKLFVRYGVLYVLAFVVFFVKQLFDMGLFNLFNSWHNSLIFAFWYIIFFIIVAYLRALYIIKNYQYIFTDTGLSLPHRSFLTVIEQSIPYQDISNLNIVYSGFGLYAVNFTGNIKRKVLFGGGAYQPMPSSFCIPGLRREDAEKIPLLTTKN